MVSIGLAGAHVQPVLEYYFEPEPVGSQRRALSKRELDGKNGMGL
jgi:hypothetical protein